VRRDPHVDLVHERVRVIGEVRGLPHLVLLVVLRVLLTRSRSRRVVPVLVVLLGRERLRDDQLVLERLQDQRTGRERLGVEEQVADRGRRRGEDPVGRPEALLLQRRDNESLRGGEAQPESADRARPQDGTSSHSPFGLGPGIGHDFDRVSFWHLCGHVTAPMR
jgi:hypothetical protein